MDDGESVTAGAMEFQDFLNSSEKVATFMLGDPSCHPSASSQTKETTCIKRKATELSCVSEEELHKILGEHIQRKRARNASGSRLLRLLPELKTYIMTFVSGCDECRRLPTDDGSSDHALTISSASH